MKVLREWFEELIFRGAAARRFTQDSPVLPDVWLEYAQAYPNGDVPVDLILTPHRDASAAELAQALRQRLAGEHALPARLRGRRLSQSTTEPAQPDIAYHSSSVVVCLQLEALIRALLPLSAWWHETFRHPLTSLLSPSGQKLIVMEMKRLSPDTKEMRVGSGRSGKIHITPDLLWTIRIVGTILLARADKGPEDREHFTAITHRHEDLTNAFARLVQGLPPLGPQRPLLWTVSRNRKVNLAIARSTLAVKADAARRVFEIDTRNLAWAILDTGIDARHPAFRSRSLPLGGAARQNAGPLAHSRVVGTFDFAHIRRLLNPDLEERPMAAAPRRGRAGKGTYGDTEAMEERAQELTRRLRRGATIDWDGLHPFLRIPHDRNYRAPRSEHGTHVAGILAADGRRDEADGRPRSEQRHGMCPDLNLYDFRVFDADERSDEFTVMAALQFIRHLNSHREQQMIHGANLSLSLLHDVANYACGRTPVCDECDRVVSSGVVVVAAAGNEGYGRFVTPQGYSEGYRSISITDPGNAESVITVGATHRYQPHTYGVSYFSSRGPTGDGRIKPDLVAPGEKITAPVPNDKWATKDGTSMAAPHVSGAAALLMARHRELIGRPQRVKEILCSTATDLKRERYFQGSGMIDVLRALQSV